MEVRAGPAGCQTRSKLVLWNRVHKNENLPGGRLAQTDVLFYREPEDDSVPLLQWLGDLPTKAQAKCVERIDRLGELGHEMRRPEADFLRGGIYELRASYQGVHYRML